MEAENLEIQQQKHFVLVHGACHGAWSWFKLKPLLESAGHRVTALDLSASGINPKSLHEIHTLEEYSQPLLQFMAGISSDGRGKVILVGHSYGGLSLALAMDQYPETISIAVFVAAFMPDTIHAPSYPLDEYFKRFPTQVLDTQFSPYGSPENAATSMLFGPQFLSKMYENCSAQDLELLKLLIRPASLFIEDLSKAKKFSTEGYGSVKRAYIACNEDKAIPGEFQHWLVETIGVAEAKEMKDSDHMPMLAMPQQLCQYLLEIAHKYT